jgi:DNA excision repair protein ERCC-8
VNAPALLPSSLFSPPPQYQLSPSHLLTSLHSASVTSLALDGIERRYLLSADAHGLLCLYDTQPPLARPTASSPHTHGPLATSTVTTGRGSQYAVNAVCWYTVDTGLFVSGGHDGGVHLWDTNLFSISHTFRLSGAVSVTSLAMSGVGHLHHLIAVGSSEPTVRLCDVNSGGFAQTLIGHRAEVTTACWTPFSEYVLVTGSVDMVSSTTAAQHASRLDTR